MTIIELIEPIQIPLGALIAIEVMDMISLIYRRTIRNKQNNCEKCKRWECEGKWCYYKYKKENAKEKK